MGWTKIAGRVGISSLPMAEHRGLRVTRSGFKQKKTETKDPHANQRGVWGGVAGCGLVAAETRGGLVLRTKKDMTSNNRKE